MRTLRLQCSMWPTGSSGSVLCSPGQWPALLASGTICPFGLWSSLLTRMAVSIGKAAIREAQYTAKVGE